MKSRKLETLTMIYCSNPDSEIIQTPKYIENKLLKLSARPKENENAEKHHRVTSRSKEQATRKGIVANRCWGTGENTEGAIERPEENHQQNN